MLDINQNLMVHAGDYPRLLPASLPVQSIGFIPHNCHTTDAVHKNIIAGFVLEGQGEWGPASHLLPVHPPCMLITRPGVRMITRAKPEWKEFYFSYAPKHLPAFQATGLLKHARAEWPVRNIGTIIRWISLLLDQMLKPLEFGSADRIDRLCEMLIMEMAVELAQPAARRNDPAAAALEAIRMHIETHYQERINLEQLAREQGWSPSTFRRKWNARYVLPPAHYILQRRMEATCRLLIETNLLIKEIATSLHFEDPLYFSKAFAHFTGCSPLAYRARYCSALKKVR